jgi:hypothetical protein
LRPLLAHTIVLSFFLSSLCVNVTFWHVGELFAFFFKPLPIITKQQHHETRHKHLIKHS